MRLEHDACIVGLFGATGSGKSARARQLLDEWKPSRLIIVDPMDEYGQFARPYASVVDLVSAMKKGARHVRLVPRGDHQSRIDQFDRLAGVAFEVGRCSFVVEELNLFTTASRAPPHWSDCTLRGRHRGMQILAISQRPAGVDKNFFSNATLVRGCALSYAEDVRCMAQVLDVHPDVVRNITRAKGPGWFVGRYVERSIVDNVVTMGTLKLGKVPAKIDKKIAWPNQGEGGALAG